MGSNHVSRIINILLIQPNINCTQKQFIWVEHGHSLIPCCLSLYAKELLTSISKARSTLVESFADVSKNGILFLFRHQLLTWFQDTSRFCKSVLFPKTTRGNQTRDRPWSRGQETWRVVWSVSDQEVSEMSQKGETGVTVLASSENYCKPFRSSFCHSFCQSWNFPNNQHSLFLCLF